MPKILTLVLEAGCSALRGFFFDSYLKRAGAIACGDCFRRKATRNSRGNSGVTFCATP